MHSLRCVRRLSLVPRGSASPTWVRSAEVSGHLQWLAQKSALGQDALLLGPPGPLKRRLVMAMAELCEWEVEYVHISKDTTESDIKQVFITLSSLCTDVTLMCSFFFSDEK